MATVTDRTLSEFTNEFVARVKPEQQQKQKGRKSTRTKPPSNEEGEDRSVPTGVSLPEPIPVHEENWGDHDFDQFSTLRVTQKDTDGGKPEYLYFVNMDNELSLLNNHP